MFKRSFLPVFLLTLSACELPPEALTESEGATEESSGQALSSDDILLRWAPVHYQDVTDESRLVDPTTGRNRNRFDSRGDLLATVDYDGDMVARNNWDNLTRVSRSAFKASIYGKLIESDTHYYLYYMFYHPIDFHVSGQAGDEHEHDAESVYLIVKKDRSPWGQLLGMVTEAHGYKITAPTTPGVTSRIARSTQLQWETLPGESFPRVRTYQESGGHGISPCGYQGGTHPTRCDLPGEDGYKYVPGRQGAVPGPLGPWVSVQYDIKPVDELYRTRHLDGRVDGSGITLWKDAPFGTTFGGDNSPGCGDGISIDCKVDAAHPIWHGTSDPVALFDYFFSFPAGLGPTATNLRNGFDNYDCQPGQDEFSVFYDGNYGGPCLTYRLDGNGRKAIHTFGAKDISSIRLGPGLHVTVFERAQFWPRSYKWYDDVSWVGGGFDNNIAALLVVRQENDCFADTVPLPGQILLYEEQDFGGHCTMFNSNDRQVSNVGEAGFPNDRLSSFKVGPNTGVTFFVDPDYRGAQFSFGAGHHASPAFANDAVTGFRIH